MQTEQKWVSVWGNAVSVAENRAIVCYGDSITAQDWPDELALRCFTEGYRRMAAEIPVAILI